MYSAPILQRPLFAFGVAVAFSVMYFAGMRALSIGPVSLASFLLIWVVPVVVCGVFHFTIVRGSNLPSGRRSLQIVVSAIGAPVLAFCLYILISIIATGEGL
jgi:hypothetical protein